jgi:hypothetical protein
MSKQIKCCDNCIERNEDHFKSPCVMLCNGFVSNYKYWKKDKNIKQKIDERGFYKYVKCN